jgi:hypothetical protein
MGNQGDIFAQLFGASSSESSFASVPGYLKAADNHNVGNVGGSWFDYNPLNIPKFAAVSVLSGLNSFYNTGAMIGNFFGANIKENKTDAWIASIDSDLGAYYRKNQDAADLVGFVVGSIAPGLAGIKVLNAGQRALAASNSGLVGSNLGLALGLRTPKIQTYISAAAKEITEGQAVFNTLTQSGVKALSAGIYQNVLEGLAFETVVQATMQASPILDQQTGKDIVWNIATGGFIGGVIGGAFSSAKTLGAIRREATELYAQIQPFGSRALIQETGNASDRLILMAYDFESGPALNPGDPQFAQQVAALQQKQKRILLDMRTETHKLTRGKDVTLGNMVADANVGQSADDILNTFIDTSEIARMNVLTRVEKAQKEAIATNGAPNPTLQVAYAKLTGENAGIVIDAPPGVFNLADTVVETAKKSGRQAVLDEVRNYGFKSNKYWDPLKLSLTGSAGHLEAEARYIWAQEVAAKVKEGQKIGHRDIPMLERALSEGMFNVTLVDEAGGILQSGFAYRTELRDYVVAVKKEVALQLQTDVISATAKGSPLESGNNLKQAQEWIDNKIAKITNSRLEALEGTAVTNVERDFFAWQTARSDYLEGLNKRGLAKVDGLEYDIRFLPTWAKITKQVSTKLDADGNIIDGLTWFKTRQELFQQSMDRVAARRLGQFYDQLPSITDRDLSLSDPFGTGATLFGFSNPKYGGPGSKASLIGSVTQRTSLAEKDAFTQEAEGFLAGLARSQEAVIEWSTINQKTSRSAEQWVRYTDEYADGRQEYLITKRGMKYAATQEEGVLDLSLVLDDMPEHIIRINTREALDLVDHHIRATDRITDSRNMRGAAQGSDQARELSIFRPIPADPKDYPFFAFVKDPRVTGQGHTSMIFAQTEKELADLVKKAQESTPELKIFFKKDTEEFFKAYQAYDYDRTLSENYIDSTLRNSGIYSNYFAKTDGQAVVNEYVRHHNKLIDTDIRETVRAKYQAAFDWWEDQAKAYSRVETSKFGGNFAKLEAEGRNPYLSYIKTALNISRINENPLWYSANVTADKAVSKVVDTIDGIFKAAKGNVSEQQINSINSLLKEYGVNTAYYDTATNLLVNHTAPKGELTKFIRGANSVLARITLALDPLNSLVNVIGSNVLRLTELKQVTDAIKAGDTEIAGEIAKLAKVDVTGQGDLVLAPAKLMSKAVENFVRGPDSLKDFYRNIGVQKGVIDTFRLMLEDFTLTGTETVAVLQSRLQSAIKKADELSQVGEKLTGNMLAEEFNRFVSADVMRQLTDPAVRKGLITAKDQIAYINTFVNRVEGNIIASQRPFVFQGPIGQAIGLFQSYQFNLIQQMFRYVAEGKGKDAAMLLGLQGTFFGVQGLPAFQAINQHIIGTASGNTNHVDLYDATYGAAGKNLGDLLLYGIPSNLLQTNLYTRGDINPRQVTILPTALNEVPIVGAYTKFFGSMKETLSKITGGANAWQAFLQGVEHNGISRPLSGLAQTLQATTGEGVPFSTTSRGSILFTNDLVSLATLSRLAGGRPLDEAIVSDGVFRIHSYMQYDREKKIKLAEMIKASSIQGQEMSEEQWERFAVAYARAGGKQANFNQFMMDQIKSANTSNAEKIVSQLQNPFAQKIQLLMGGE